MTCISVRARRDVCTTSGKEVKPSGVPASVQAFSDPLRVLSGLEPAARVSLRLTGPPGVSCCDARELGQGGGGGYASVRLLHDR